MFDKKIKPDTLEGKSLQTALHLIKQYEDKHYTELSIPSNILLS